MTRQWIRWMPAAAMPAVIAAAVLAGPLQASARVELPDRTPSQVLAMIAGNKMNQLSGTLEEKVNVGLPQLPGLGTDSPGSSTAGSGPSSSSATAGSPPTAAGNPLGVADISQLVGFLTVPHTMRIYMNGATSQRVQILDKLAERDVIRHGNTIWAYDTAANTATELTLPNPRLPMSKQPGALAPGSFERAPGNMPTPAALAAELLKNLGPSTQISLAANTTVARRSAYVLQIVPRSTETLIGKVSIAVDAGTGLPLRVTVTARGQNSAALEVGFSKLDLAAPPASTFLFTPPPGTIVTRKAIPALPAPSHAVKPGLAPKTGTPAKGHDAAKAATSGSGWATIVEAPPGTVGPSLTASPALAQLLQTVPGGHALSTTVFNVLITPDGGVFAGAVPLAALQQAAAAK